MRAVQEELGSYGIDLVNNRFLILQVCVMCYAAQRLVLWEASRGSTQLKLCVRVCVG